MNFRILVRFVCESDGLECMDFYFPYAFGDGAYYINSDITHHNCSTG